jgi:hypothetical protein
VGGNWLSQPSAGAAVKRKASRAIASKYGRGINHFMAVFQNLLNQRAENTITQLKQ